MPINFFTLIFLRAYIYSITTLLQVYGGISNTEWKKYPFTSLYAPKCFYRSTQLGLT